MDIKDIKSPEMAIKGTWTVQEDELLKDAVQKIGTTKWIDIAKFVPSRTPKQCRERWHNRLSPELKHGPFEPWEDQIIITKQKEIGNRWSLIAQSLPGRSPGSVKNRWYAGLRNSNQNTDFSITQINGMMNDQQITSSQLEQV
ncbi:Myb-like DNA-binding domain containing protein [Histomonas meleagridis]|uniref:Myb-like DNA-binding domain containing protein n=1 Tax=Histomonas meleagridis TaxID=135588 RepID=UPI003559903D|nr:Myb-like DNA-binding domain containing protein [Histomonas meleagridis]KAH0803221.1 Myb-like DNA-binding domain containing protein [Histomonas meleagridis]